MVFPAVMCGCESWTVKKAEHRRTDAFELWCWRRLLRIPWSVRSNQSILKEISPEYSLEGLMLRLNLQYFGSLMRRAKLIRKDLDARKDWRQKEKEIRVDEMVGWHHWVHGYEFEQALGDGEGQRSLMCYSPWGGKESDTMEQLNNNNNIPCSLQRFWTEEDTKDNRISGPFHFCLLFSWNSELVKHKTQNTKVNGTWNSKKE